MESGDETSRTLAAQDRSPRVDFHPITSNYSDGKEVVSGGHLSILAGISPP